jgi:hypothetical protein
MFKYLNKLDLKVILIIGLLVVVFLMRTCNQNKDKTDTIKINGKKYDVIQHDIDTQYLQHDTIIYKKGKNIIKDTTIFVEIPSIVDTNKILQDFYAKNVYKDTITLNDSLGTISLIDTISENKIQDRKYNIKVREKIVKEFLVVKEPSKGQLYIGGTINVDKINLLNYVGPSLLYKTKKDNLYSFGIGYGINKSVSIQGGTYWKIKLKK